MLEINDLIVSVLDKTILDNFNIKINDGEIHAIMGPNGAGKSTICRTIMGDENYKVQSGRIIFNGENITKLSTTERSRKGLYLISQNPIAIDGVTNAEMLRACLAEIKNEHVNIFEFNKKMEKICQKINLPISFIHRNINDGMSGGERKKNELLHLWMLEPKFIILDEIDSGLDVDSLKEVALSIKEYHDISKATVLIITHHNNILNYIEPDYVHILKNKKIVETGDYSLAEKIELGGFNILDNGENHDN